MSFRLVGCARSPFGDKFGVPRQPGLAPVPGHIELDAPWGRAEALSGLEGFSHVWVVFLAHAIPADTAGRRLTVRPPRLGGDARVGLWASRSLFRPNRIGLSLLEITGIEIFPGGRARVGVAAIDLIDGTPVLDLKPYLPYAESVPHARGGFASASPTPALAVEWSAEAEEDAVEAERIHPGFRAQVSAVLALDPRPPAARDEPERVHGLLFAGRDVRFTVRGESVALVVSAPAPSRGHL